MRQGVNDDGIFKRRFPEKRYKKGGQAAGKEMAKSNLRGRWNRSSEKEIKEKGEAVASIF